MPALESFGATAERLYVRLAMQGIRYWFIALAVLIASILVTPYFDRHLGLFHARWSLFQHLSETIPPPLQPRFIKIVLIGDKERYGSVLHVATPVNRDYLAKLIANLSDKNVPVIALDFDLRLTLDGATGALRAYDQIAQPQRAETGRLMAAIVKAAAHSKIVLANTVGHGKIRGYSLTPNAYQIYGICVDHDGVWQNPGTKEFPIDQQYAAKRISCGYINFPGDMRLIPPRVPLDQGGSIDGFSYAVAYAANPRLVSDLPSNRYFVSFIRREILEKAVMPAGPIYDDAPGQDITDYIQPIIIGAKWSYSGSGQGDFVDQVDTPVGRMSGALIHAEYSEAALDGRTYRLIPGWIPQAADYLLAALTAIVFGLISRISTKIAVFAGIVSGLILLQLLALHFGAAVFESFVPIFGLLVHSVLERMLGLERAHPPV